MRSKQGVPQELVLGLDATDDPVHGNQLGKFFHGYYKSYCYLPLYTFCDAWPLGAVLRPSNIDGCAGTVQERERIVPKLRAAWPQVKIIIRADSGFCRDEILRWCEAHNVGDIIGLAKNKRLNRAIGSELRQALELFEETGVAARVFKDFTYRTKKSWSCERRAIGKAEHLSKGANPRFVVTSLSKERTDARTLYEDRSCARGEMENRIRDTATVSVRRSHEYSCDAFQPVASAVFDDGVSAASWVAGIWPCRNRNGEGSGRHHSFEAAEDRPPPYGERSTHLHRLE